MARVLAIGALLALLACGRLIPAADAQAARPPGDASGPRLALVIGNSAYPKLVRLKNPGNDARLMSARLRQAGFEVTETMDRDRAGLSEDIAAFARAIRARGRNTVSVLYYAGHGVEDDSINYIIPVDAEIRRKADIRRQSVSVKGIADQLAEAGNMLNILIVDACRDNPFADSGMPAAPLGLAPMAAVLGVFIASSTASGKAALDGEKGHSPYTETLAEQLLTPGQKLEDVFKSVRRRVRLATADQQISWESTAVETDFYFVPPPLSPEAQLLAAAAEADSRSLYAFLVERFPGSPEAAKARLALAASPPTAPDAARQTESAAAPATPAAQAALERAKQARTAEAFDLVVTLFPDTPQAEEAKAAASRLREATILDSAGPEFRGRELTVQLQQQLVRLSCLSAPASGEFDSASIAALRRSSLLTDDRFLWHRPTMAAFRALRKIDAAEGCAGRQFVSSAQCIRIGRETLCP